jgi:N-acetylglucosaminyldiphosphoundecaprenol N-acetyl-beta-D-mannosaminyltransferase
MSKSMAKSPTAFSVLGLPVHVASNYPSWLVERLQNNIGTHVVTLNAEMTMQAEQNPDLAQIIRDAELVIPDGAGVVLYLKLLLRQPVKRVPGIELSESLLLEAAKIPGNTKIFLYGGAPEVAQKAAEYWREQAPNINIIGTYSGYHSEAEAEQLAQTLSQLQPQVILVGLGVPRQEFWIAQNRHLCPHAIWVGVGGSFDIWSGTKTRAPAWLGDNNLEWLYRLYQEPWRWRRMLALPRFAVKAAVYATNSKQ